MSRAHPIHVLAFAVLVLVACGQSGGGDGSAPAPAKAAPTGPARRVEVKIVGMSFEPSKIEARPNERLDLVFSRPTGPSCMTAVIFADGTRRDLPEGTPVTVAVTAPPEGALRFECPEGHARGRIQVASP